ncbi:unnamed protein product, partial [marine sediment metagenome]
TDFLVTGLTPGVAYEFRVRAYNAAGNSDYSVVKAKTTDATYEPTEFEKFIRKPGIEIDALCEMDLGKEFEGFPFMRDDDLVLCLPFDEGTGVTAYDKSGNGNNGTLINMEEGNWVDGKVGKCLDFDGEDDYVSISNITISKDAGAISLWVYSEADFTGQRLDQGHIIGFGGDKFKRYLALVGSGIGGYMLMSETNLNEENFVNVVDAVPKGQWNHILVSFDSGVATSFVNGSQVDQISGITNDWTLNRMGFMHADVPFTGKIDEVRIYKRA